ncbi:bifunctional phosphopantothenoylcysteine decarboxylase/phosphopantothenate--cysteine ligase CoaBC [Virgibacillus xinjiangensis]|uniref:Coenzyme A biosynthesis bifunctional protein CoaBC n=1 Tax=Virgibacillus xinjiangensis TaxID=393090 RepID=A0ABV7CUW1_9BACI
MMEGKNILLGVSGGIAAYKACALASKLTQKGADVRVMMTENSREFVAPLTFQALTRNPVYIDTFDEKDPEKIAHVDVADWADIILLAPATANIIGKIAGGIADGMLATTLLASKADVYIAPAMNVNMYAHPAVVRNMKQLEEWGYHFIEPGAGYLACGWVGKGRLEEPEQIIHTIEQHQSRDLLLLGKKVLISAGPTREDVDPVRFFTNRSSGRMGYALAEEAANLGAEVTLVTGPTELKLTNDAIKQVDVITAEEMFHVMHEHFPSSDIVIKAAAVADYRPKQVYKDKMKKQEEGLTIEMVRTKDILKSLGEMKNGQYLVGFAAETSNPLEYGRKKLTSKNLDAIVINNVSSEGAGFGGATNIVTYLNKFNQQHEVSLASKHVVAGEILRFIDRDMKDEEG